MLEEEEEEEEEVYRGNLYVGGSLEVETHSGLSSGVILLEL